MPEEIRKNLYRVPVPLPGNPLKELNSYVIKGSDRTLVVDTGFRQEPCRRALFAGLRELDVLVNNAGICHYGLLSQTPEAVWDRIFAVNVRGTYLCTQAAIPLFLQKHRGAIINVSSMWGQVGASCEAAYSASKGAILALTKALAKELGPSGIRVNAVAPGVILTDMVAHVDPAVLEALREETPLERNGRPEDVAKAMVYLAGAEFITGQILPVNGGFVIT